MMPLTMVKTGEENTIKKVGGKEETRRFLENLGFVTGGVVTVDRWQHDRECQGFEGSDRKRHGKQDHGLGVPACKL